MQHILSSFRIREYPIAYIYIFFLLNYIYIYGNTFFIKRRVQKYIYSLLIERITFETKRKEFAKTKHGELHI